MAGGEVNVEKRIITNNYTTGRSGQVPQVVVVHTYNGAGTYLDSWFNSPSTQASAHYSILKNGVVAQYVDEGNTAWHAGNWDINVRSIGIEHQDDGNPSDSVRTKELYESSAQLIASIYKKYQWDVNNKSLVKPHKDFTSTGCPGGLDINRIRNRVYDILHSNINNDLMDTYIHPENVAGLEKVLSYRSDWPGIKKTGVQSWWINNGANDALYRIAANGWLDVYWSIVADKKTNIADWVAKHLQSRMDISMFFRQSVKDTQIKTLTTQLTECKNSQLKPNLTTELDTITKAVNDIKLKVS